MAKIFVTLALVLLASFCFAAQPNLVVTSSVYESSHVLMTTHGELYSIVVNYHTAALRSIMIFDGTAVPSDGVTSACGTSHPHTAGCLLWCVEGDTQGGGAVESNVSHSWGNVPLIFDVGAVVVASTNTAGCANLTADTPNEWFSAQIDL
jgi:hypothetical protein